MDDEPQDEQTILATIYALTGLFLLAWHMAGPILIR